MNDLQKQVYYNMKWGYPKLKLDRCKMLIYNSYLLDKKVDKFLEQVLFNVKFGYPKLKLYRLQKTEDLDMVRIPSDPMNCKLNLSTLGDEKNLERDLNASLLLDASDLLLEKETVKEIGEIPIFDLVAINDVKNHEKNSTLSLFKNYDESSTGDAYNFTEEFMDGSTLTQEYSLENIPIISYEDLHLVNVVDVNISNYHNDMVQANTDGIEDLKQSTNNTIDSVSEDGMDGISNLPRIKSTQVLKGTDIINLKAHGIRPRFPEHQELDSESKDPDYSPDFNDLHDEDGSDGFEEQEENNEEKQNTKLNGKRDSPISKLREEINHQESKYKNNKENVLNSNSFHPESSPRTIKVKKNKTKILIPDAAINTNGVGNGLREPEKVIIDSSDSSKPKKYRCCFCDKNFAGKLINHLFQKHPEEEEVKKIRSLPPARRKDHKPFSAEQSERIKLIDKIRKRGRKEHNLTLSENEQPQLPRRSQKDKEQKDFSSYRMCPFCNDMYGKNSIRKHYILCTGTEVSNNPTASHNLIVGDVNMIANMYCRKVLSILSNDEISKIAKQDYLIVQYANFESLKYKFNTVHNRQIRAQVRLCARILIKIKELAPEIQEMSDIFKPKYIHKIIEVTDILGQIDSSGKYKTPNTARDVGRMLKALGELWKTECIIEASKAESDFVRELWERKNNNVQSFMTLIEHRFPKLVSKTVSESITAIDLEKGATKLPDTSDIKLLVNYLRKLEEKHSSNLKKRFALEDYIILSEVELLLLLILNRKRPLEVSSFLKAVYMQKQELNESTNPDLYKKLSKEAKKISSKYRRCEIRGKKNAKRCPLLLPKRQCDNIDLLISHRAAAGVDEHNKYVFGVPYSKGERSFFDAGTLLAKYAKLCGSKMPTLLRGTKLRKHIATVGLALDLTDGEVDDLSTFMGHDKAIHMNIYRQPIAAKDIFQVSKWLEYAQGDYIETPTGNVLLEDECCSDESETEENEGRNNCNKKKIINSNASGMEENDASRSNQGEAYLCILRIEVVMLRSLIDWSKNFLVARSYSTKSFTLKPTSKTNT